MDTMMIDVVITCPECDERVALAPVSCVPSRVTNPAGTFLTATIGDVECKPHSCDMRSRSRRSLVVDQAEPGSITLAPNPNVIAGSGS